MQSTARSRLGAALVLAGVLLAAGVAASGEAPALDAKFVKMSALPKTVLTGQVFRVAITMKNTGTRAWGPAIKDHSVLRSRAPADNTTWGTHFIIQGQGKTCKPGAEFTYASYLMAPSKPGEYVFQWQPARMDRGSYRGPATVFGEPTPRAVIQVRQRPPSPATAPTTRPASGKKVLSFDDFEYAGSFKIPRRPKQDLPYSHSGLAIRKAKDGTKRMFFNYTLPGMVLVEVAIPPLVKLDATRDHKALKTAKVVKDWGRLAVKSPKVREHPNLKEVFAKGGFWWDDAEGMLYWTWWHSYWCGGAPPVLGASRLPEDGEATHYGPWFVASNHKWYWGGVTGLPKAFAEKYTGGRTLAMGYGTGYSGTYAGSLGPSLGAIDRPDPKKTSVPVIPLLGYYKGAAAPRDGGYFLVGGRGWMGTQPKSPDEGSCTSSDLIRNGIFIDTPAKWGFIAFYRLQMGRIGYDYGAVTAGSYEHCWYFYDPDDLGAVAKGLKKPGQVMPRSRTFLRDRPGDPVARARGVVTGSCFDPETNLLYVHAALCNGCIHAYRVKDPGVAK